jgi:hypothetical protein
VGDARGQGAPAAASAALHDNQLAYSRRYALVLASNYGWRLNGHWLTAEASVLLAVAQGIERYVERVSGADGRQWMHAYLGPINFHSAAWINHAVDANLALPGGHIYVLEGFGGSPEPHTDLAHEVAHVLDNNLGGWLPATVLGGGPSDEMLSEVGGNPNACQLRFLCPVDYTRRIAGPEHWPTGAYANSGVSEDFAEAFSYAVFFPERVPAMRLAWVENFVVATAGQMPPGAR